MKTKHTKGQWYVNGKVYFSIESKHPEGLRHFHAYPTIAVVNTESRREVECRANALLIASAPDMLDMLIDIADELRNGDTPHLYKIDELIKKATGDE